MPKCNFNEVAKQRRNFNKVVTQSCSALNLLHIFRATFPKNMSGGLLLCQGNKFQITFFCFLQVEYPVDTGRKLNVCKTFR